MKSLEFAPRNLLLPFALCAVLRAQDAPPPTLTMPDGTVRVSGGVIAGHLLNKVTPVIPREVLNARVSGVVVMHVIIGKDGNVETVSVISEAPAMRQPVVDAVKQWTYRPYLLNGHPVKVGTTVTCDLVFGAASGK